MKTTLSILSLVSFLLVSYHVSAGTMGAFGGESKQSYIKRCATSEMPNFTYSQKKAFCVCFANKLEAGYDRVIKSIKPSDTVESAQRKMNEAGQQSASQCMK